VPISYEIDATTGVLNSVFTGKVGPRELLDWYDELQRHPDFRPDLTQIAEFRMSEADWTPDEMKEVVTREPFGPGARRAFVGPVDLIYGLARMYSTFAETMGQGGQIEVFRTVEEARAWIDALPKEPDS
jgi:hypothetical protein